jgi:hypothetical protein
VQQIIAKHFLGKGSVANDETFAKAAEGSFFLN